VSGKATDDEDIPMKLTIRRNQADVKGLFGGHKGVRFSLFGRVQVSTDENALIERYKVGDYALADYELRLGKEIIPFRYGVKIRLDRLIL
jgi:hypothetical protein